MTDHVSLTVRSKANDFIIDMELPTKISIADLEPQLLENLKAIAPHQFMEKDEIHIRYMDNVLKPTETLATSCVWDGTIIDVI